MNFLEEALVFACAGEWLIGVLCRPRQPLDTAVIIVVGGPQYRAGSHRQFVLLARSLSQAGYPVLRFDVRGMGDSSGAPRSFEQLDADLAAAIDETLRLLPAVRRVVLWGLCDGASAALLYCARARDERVAGLCLLNPWVRSEASLARTRIKHYYLQRLLEPAFWLKLRAGKVSLSALHELCRNLVRSLARAGAASGRATGTSAPYQHRMADGWRRFGGPLLLLLSGNDYTAREFLEYVSADPLWRGALEHPHLERHDIEGADHTASDGRSREQVEQLTLNWLRAAFAPAGAMTAAPARAATPELR